METMQREKYRIEKNFYRQTQKNEDLFDPTTFRRVYFTPVPIEVDGKKFFAVKYSGEKFKSWYYPGTPAKVIIGRLITTGKNTIQTILIPKDKKPGYKIKGFRLLRRA